MSEQTYLQRAIENVKTASELDAAKKYKDAIRMYSTSVEFFVHSLKYEIKQERAKTTIQYKCDEYLKRAETLQNFLNENGGKDGIEVQADIDKKADGPKKVGNSKDKEVDKHMEMMDSAIVVEKPNVKFGWGWLVIESTNSIFISFFVSFSELQ